MDVRAILIGLVIGLVFGAGLASGVWAITSSGGGGGDVTAVCGMVERTPDPDKNTDFEGFRRWAGLNEVMVGVAKDDPSQRPLAEALEKVTQGITIFDFDMVNENVAKARALCDNA